MAEMSFQIEALDEILTNCILGCQKQDWPLLDTVFDLLVRTYQVDAKRIILQDQMIQKIFILFSKVDFVTLKDHMNLHFSINANIFRLLRNCCAGSPRNVQLIVRHENLLAAALCWLRYFTDRELDNTQNPNHGKMLVALKCCLQFLANAVGGGPSSGGDPIRRYVWQNFDFNTQRKLLAAECHGVRKITSCIMYNCMLDDAIFRSVVEELTALVTLVDVVILELRTPHPSEWSSFIIQRILQHQVAMDDVLRHIPIERNINLIDEMTNMLTHDNSENRASRISEFNLIPFFRLLKQKLVDLKVERSVSESHPRNFDLIFSLLKLACEVTANEQSKYSFLEDGELFKLTSTVLQIIHKVYKPYTLKEGMLIQLQPNVSATLQMKRHLVRLIANLAYNRPFIQNLANKLDTVPLVLDLAHHDFHNPFIREWSIVAVANLLKNHPTNQAIVKGMFKEHFTNNASFLEEVKLKLENDNINLQL